MSKRATNRITMAGPAANPSKQPLPAGLLSAALDELRSAAATYDYLRATGDPVEFWEALCLARSRRGLPAREDGAPTVPSAPEEASLRKELDGIRERLSEPVAELRDFLERAPELLKPADRFEFALAFLMASSREHKAVVQWLREPDKHLAIATGKIRSLAGITDPYREALLPWSIAETL